MRNIKFIWGSSSGYVSIIVQVYMIVFTSLILIRLNILNSQISTLEVYEAFVVNENEFEVFEDRVFDEVLSFVESEQKETLFWISDVEVSARKVSNFDVGLSKFDLSASEYQALIAAIGALKVGDVFVIFDFCYKDSCFVKVMDIGSEQIKYVFRGLDVI